MRIRCDHPQDAETARSVGLDLSHSESPELTGRVIAALSVEERPGTMQYRPFRLELADMRFHLRINDSARDVDVPPGTTLLGVLRDEANAVFDASGARAKTGKLLWETKVAGNAQANPVSYAGKNGEQYVAVDAADFVVAFSLP